MRLAADSRRTLVRATLLGAATGARSTFGLAALAATSRSAVLARPPVRAVIALAVAVEVVMDKLPSTPSRLRRPGLVSRLGASVIGGAVLARRDDENAVGIALAASATAAGSALVFAVVGSTTRSVIARRGGSGGLAGVGEDALAASLAAMAVGRQQR